MENEKTVLLVEDEDALRLALRDYLAKQGYTVHVASDGAGAIEQILDHEIDIIVSDYRMNVLGGHYWVRFLKRFCPDTKVILTSAYLDSEVDNPFPVITKPFEFAFLTETIESMLG